MAKIEARRVARRFLFLGALVLGLVVQTATYNSQTAAACNAENAALICCSACEADPPPLPCRHGCSPSC